MSRVLMDISGAESFMSRSFLTKDVGAEFVAGDAGEALDVEHARGRDSVPLRNRLGLDPQFFRQRLGRAGCGNSFLKCVVHGRTLKHSLIEKSRMPLLNH